MIIKNTFNQSPRFDNARLFTKHHNCPVCRSANIKHILTSHDNHYNVSGQYEHYECRKCLALFLNPMPTEAFLKKAYPTDYYAYQEHKHDHLIITLLKKLLFMYYTTGDPTFSKPSVMLDIGCGSGEFLALMHAKGWETYGVEPSESAARRGNQHPGLKIHNGTLMTAKFPDRTFDYIRSNHSLEHIPNPHENLSEIARIIKPGGKFFIGVPNTESLAFKIFKSYWWNLGAPQHPINYSERSLKTLVTPYGFKIVSSKTNSPYTGLLGSLQIKVNNKHNKRSDRGAYLDFIPFRIISGFSSRLLDLFKMGDCLEMVFEKN